MIALAYVLIFLTPIVCGVVSYNVGFARGRQAR